MYLFAPKTWNGIVYFDASREQLFGIVNFEWFATCTNRLGLARHSSLETLSCKTRELKLPRGHVRVCQLCQDMINDLEI